MMVDEAMGCWVGGPVTDLLLTTAQPAAARRQYEGMTPVHSLGT